MSTVLPNGTIRFLQNVPIDEDYQNSLDFLTLEAQREYFLGLTPVYTMIGATRVREGVIDVSINSDTLLPCNYLMFQNMDFYNKWFYAFITDIEYINNNMTRVYYALDDIQTWLFDVELEECFVEREHTTTDRMFEHLVNENINIDEYVNSDTATNELELGSFDALLFYYGSIDTSVTPPRVVPPDIVPRWGNLNALNVSKFEVQDANGNWYDIVNTDPSVTPLRDWNGMELLNYYIKLLTEGTQSETIVGVVLVPKMFTDNIPDNRYAKDDIYFNFINFDTNHPLDGYTPKNNKLYNYPFCVIELGTSDGQKVSLEPEYLLQGQNEARVFLNVAPISSMLIVPKQYKGNNYAWDKSLSFDAFPQCAIAIDSYKAWIASGGAAQLTWDTAKSFANSFVTSMQSPLSGATQIDARTGFGIIGGVEAIGDAVIKGTLARKEPPVIKGNFNTQVLPANEQVTVYSRQMTITSDQAKSIDNYFTMFGYKVNKIKKPSRRNRPHYTYVKTKSCKVIGGAPADAINRIQIIYDNGIRFWVNASEVGHYTDINNSPT